jgi:hypothetical protein
VVFHIPYLKPPTRVPRAQKARLDIVGHSANRDWQSRAQKVLETVEHNVRDLCRGECPDQKIAARVATNKGWERVDEHERRYDVARNFVTADSTSRRRLKMRMGVRLERG